MSEAIFYQWTVQALFLLLCVALVLALFFFFRALKHKSAAAFFNDILEQGSLPRQILGKQGRVLWSNQAAEAFTGVRGGAVPDTIRAELADDPESLAKLDYLQSQSHAGKYGVALFKSRGRLAEKLGFSSDGEGVVIIAASPIQQEEGGALWSIGFLFSSVIRDIFEAEREPAITLLDAFSLGYYALDDTGTLVAINTTFADWLKRPREDSIGKLKVADLLAHKSGEGVYKGLIEAGQEKGRGLVTLRAQGGDVFNVVVSEQRIAKTPSGNIQAHGLVKLLGPHGASDQPGESAGVRIERFIHETPIAIVQFSFERRVLDVNPAFCRLMNRERDQILGQALEASVIAGEQTKLTQEVEKFLANLSSPQREGSYPPFELHLDTNPEKVSSFFLNVYEDEVGNPLHLIAYILDTTEQKSLETQFVQSQKMQAVGQLAGGIAHDFNNLLTAMIGFSDLLLLRHRPGDPSFTDIMQIKQNANRAANLVRQLLAFSRQQSLQPRVLNLTDILTELSHLLRRLIGERIDLQVIHGRDLGQVKADQGQLEQVIINLAVNARDAMPGGGELKITTANRRIERPLRNRAEIVPAGNYIMLEVVDTGCGIAEEYQDRIFDPFFSTKEVGEGTGLGLSTVYGIVKQTGGFILLDSKIGQGTTFTVLLPCFEATPEQVAAEEVETIDSQDLTGRETILLVEDEDAVRAFAARTLKNKGYNVLEARSGEEALELLKKEMPAPDLGADTTGTAGKDSKIDLIITDVVMPKMDGSELALAVHKIWPEMKIIFISGYAEETFRSQLGEDSRIQFLPKPFNLKQLAATVKKTIAQ